MKLYLLIAGEDYYPRQGDADWIGCFETYEEAKSKALEIKVQKDWYEIIHLSKYIFENNEEENLE